MSLVEIICHAFGCVRRSQAPAMIRQPYDVGTIWTRIYERCEYRHALNTG
jgi:hypothetical protein